MENSLRIQVLDLLNIYSLIYEKYVSLEKGSAYEILYLLILAENKFRKLDVKSMDSRKEIIGILYENPNFIDSEIPFGIEGTIEKDVYPYYRLMARIKYETFTIETQNENADSIRRFLDNQIANVYNYLIDLNDENLKRRAQAVLMNSPEIERNCLLNGLKPFKEVYDTLDFELGFKSIVKMIALGIIDPSKVVDTLIVSNEIRIALYIHQIRLMSESIDNNGLVSEEQRQVVKAYITSLSAVLDEDDILDIRFELSELVSNLDVQDLANDCFSEVGKVMKYRRKVSIINESDL